MKPGDTVKRSEHAIRPKRDYWLSCGREPMRSVAQGALDTAKADRGVIIEGPTVNAYGAEVIVVRLTSGAVESAMSYLWEPA